MAPDQCERIERELAVLKMGGQLARLVSGAGRDWVIYEAVTVQSSNLDHPDAVDVIVPVPGGYPAGAIDLAGVQSASVLLPLVAGGKNPQAVVEVEGASWTLASYHPHGNGGGPSWDPSQHGFHTYLGELLAWLAKIG